VFGAGEAGASKMPETRPTVDVRGSKEGVGSWVR